MRKILSTINALIVSLLLVLTSTVSQVYAIGIDFSTNDVRIYDPNAEDPIACGGAGFLTGSDNLEKIYNFLVSKGLSSVQAAAVTGNMAIESDGAEDPLIVERHPSMSLPKSTNDPGSLPSVSGWPGGGAARQPGWGLIQWTPASKFVTHAKALEINQPYELEAQLEVIWWHMVNTTPTGRTDFNSEFTKITNIAKATEVFMNKFLAPLASMNHYEERLAAAESALGRFGSNVPGTPPPTPGVGTGVSDSCLSPGVGGVPGDPSGVIATALKYAWPTEAYTLTLKPEYKAAIEKAKANGENVKGASWGPDGVDCHIYIKRIMRDSGADPSYSSDISIPQAMDYMATSPVYREYRPQNESELKPGTIIAYNNGAAPGQPGRHILMYVGANNYLENGNKVAEASLPTYSPQAGWTDPMGGPYKAYHRYFQIVNATPGAI